MSVRVIKLGRAGGSGGGAGQPVVTTWSGHVLHVFTPPATGSGSLIISSDGSILGTRYGGDIAWYLPTGGTPGTGYYVRFTQVGAPWNPGLVANTVYSLSSSRTLAWTGAGQTNSTVTVRIYTDSGGTVLVGTGTVTVTVESTL